MNRLYTLLLLLAGSISFAQIRGTITDKQKLALPVVSVMVENTYIGTSSNESGAYELPVQKPGTYTLIYRYLGFRTKKVTVDIRQFPFVQDIVLEEEELSLDEVVINPKDNPADRIIRSAIAARKENADRTARYNADFYSRGIFRVKDVPKRFLGQEVGDLDGMIDSTRAGILYLSETVSKISFQKPDDLKERIIASKVSGNDNGFSYNTARASSYDFYDNTIEWGLDMISPIAPNAFSYYKYKMEGSFIEGGHTINKIRVIPRRDNEPVFDGHIYIVDDSWAIYAVDLHTTGARMQQDILNDMKIVQNFSYNGNENLWAKNLQSLEFTASFFGVKVSGKFSYVYTNYDFKEAFDKKTFGKEIVSFEDNSNKKDSLYWNANRQIPLTSEETRDYVRKDSIRDLRESPKYLDSLDRKSNRFRISKVIFGYTYRNSFKKYAFGYRGFEPLSTAFNTVQGWNLKTGLFYRSWKNQETEGKYTNLGVDFHYGFSDKRLRMTGYFNHRFNNKNYGTLSLSGGSAVRQFNPEEPIAPLINTVSTLFFKDNYMKLYNNEFASVSYGQFVSEGLQLTGKVEYSQRKPLVNTTDYVLIKQDDVYTSNNPLDPLDDAPAFATHHLTKASLSARITFGNKYISRPDGKIIIRDEKYPVLFLGYENAFAASEESLGYQFASGRLFYELDLSNKGSLAMNLKGGKFFDADGISFIDYKHFNGNQTHVGTDDRYLNVFNLLPYYEASTNDAYSENHIEYNDSAFFMNKVPVLKWLKANLVLGFHSLAIPDRKPYMEFTAGLDHLGFGKFRMFRVDYVRSYQGGFRTDGVVFGLKILNVL